MKLRSLTLTVFLLTLAFVLAPVASGTTNAMLIDDSPISISSDSHEFPLQSPIKFQLDPTPDNSQRVIELPATGETPWWRLPVLIIAILLPPILLGILLWTFRKLPDKLENWLNRRQ